MRDTLIHRASLRPRSALLTFGPWRALIGAATVVVLLVLLFATAISAALHPSPAGEPTQAAIEGGL